MFIILLLKKKKRDYLDSIISIYFNIVFESVPKHYIIFRNFTQIQYDTLPPSPILEGWIRPYLIVFRYYLAVDFTTQM